MRNRGCLVAVATCLALSACWGPNPYVGWIGSGRSAIPAAGGSWYVEGALSGSDDTWRRPESYSCTSSDGGGPRHAYDSYVVFNPSESTRSVRVDVLAEPSGVGTLGDPMLFVWQGWEHPADLSTCVAADDDGGNGLEPSLLLAAEPGGSYYIAVTSYRDVEADRGLGTYELHLTTE